MSDSLPKVTRNDSARKARPSVQLYRPGMLRATTEGSSKKSRRERSANSEHSTKSPDARKTFGNDKENGEKEPNRKQRPRGKEFISSTLWRECDDVERDYILNKNDYANLNRLNENQRRSSNGSSSNSGTYKMEVNSNGSSRKNGINKSCDHLADDFDNMKRKPGSRMYSNINYSSSQSLCESSSAHNRDYDYNVSGSWHFGKKTLQRNQNRTWDRNSSYRDNSKNNNRDEVYPGTYRYHSQPRNDYSGGDMRRNFNKYHPAQMHDASGEGPAYNDGNGQRRTGFGRSGPLDRQRNWSFRSNQSERFDQHRRYRYNKGNNNSADRTNASFQEKSQDVERKDNATKKLGTPSEHLSFQDLCASLDSIDLASFDWSSEVEAEERRKKEREEQERIKTEQKSRTAPSAAQSEGLFRGGIGAAPSKFQNRSRGRGSSTGGGFGRFYSSHDEEPSIVRNTHRFTNRLLPRQRNDSYTSQTSSIAESIEEQSDMEGGSGERTPTNEQRTTTINPGTQESTNKGKTCYLDEEIPIVIRGRGRDGPATNYGNYRGGNENRGRSKHGNRWRTRKLENTRPAATSSSGAAESCSTRDNTKNSNNNNDNDLSATTSTAPTAVPPTAARVISVGLKGAISEEVLRSSPQEEHSETPSPSAEAKTPLADVSAESSLKRVAAGKSNRFRQELPPTEWPIHLEISNKEGPQIQALNDTINQLIDRVTESADVNAGEEILLASESLSKLYLSIVTRDIDYTYTMNLEQHLWKQCFYTSIEALRAASNSTGNASRIFRASLSKLIQQALAFYALLLNKYEVAFGFVIDDFLYWQTGLPTDDFVGCALISSAAHDAADRMVKVALLSAQRLAVSVGDLHRYNAMVSGIKDYSQARLWYQKGAQLAAGNGRSYNQLALLAVYTIIQRSPMRSARDMAFVRVGSFIRAKKCKLQSKWIDVIFYYVRALAARYPFETARQPLFTAFNHVQKKVSEFEAEFSARIGDSVTLEAHAAAARADRPHEIWIAQDGKLSAGDFANIADNRTVHMLDSVSAVELFRRAVPYVLHTAGLLITKIGMEEYEGISERALFQLSRLISRDECPLTSLHLVQLCTLFLYAVHNLSLKNTEPGTCSLQQQQAVQMVLSVFGVILKPIHDQLADLPAILAGTTQLPSKMRRVLPAVFVISEWLSMPSVNRLYASMPSLESIETSLIQIDTWKVFADVANSLVSAESKGILSRTLAQFDTKSEQCSEIVLPESVFLASFIDVFTAQPKSLRMSFLANIDLQNNSHLLALHARLSSLLATAEYLDGSELPCFGFDEHLRRFAANRCVSPATVPITEVTTKCEIDFDQECDRSEVEHETTEQDLGHLSDEHQRYRQTVRENQIKQELLERETKGNRVIIEVRPQYLVPDTNAFIDHLESIKRIVESRRFTVLVPTTVLSELTGLSQPADSSKQPVGMSESLQDNWVSERAKEADNYLHDMAEKRTPQIYTVTSKGNRLPTLNFSAEDYCSSRHIKTVNDDFILSSCVALTATLPVPSSATTTGDVEQPPRLYRSVVLLTEDRALNIKAVCANIPCRTVPSFMKWAAFK